MRREKIGRLKQSGWKVRTVEAFLNLSSEESTYVELKLRLSESLRYRRERRNLTQVEMARLIHSSQSRLAKMEKGDPSVSIDLLIKSQLALGASSRDLAKTIGSSSVAAGHHEDARILPSTRNQMAAPVAFRRARDRRHVGLVSALGEWPRRAPRRLWSRRP